MQAILFIVPGAAVIILLIAVIITIVVYLVVRNNNAKHRRNVSSSKEYNGIDTLNRSMHGKRTTPTATLDRRYGKLERPLPFPGENKEEENYQDQYEIPDYCLLHGTWSNEISGPIFIKEPKSNADFLNTEGILLDCSAHGIPDPEISCFTEDQYRQDIHATVYKCMASNIHGSIISYPVSVKATTKQQQQQLQAQVYDEYVIPGNTAVLTCHIPPFYKRDLEIISWIREDNLIVKANSPKNGLKMTTDGKLLIESVESSTNVELGYWCQIKNKLTADTFLSQSAGQIKLTEHQGEPLEVYIRPNVQTVNSGDEFKLEVCYQWTSYIAPAFIQKFKSKKLQPGPSIALKCIATGRPTPRISWSLNGQTVSPDNKFILRESRSKNGSAISSLIVKNIRSIDGGDYSCVATNKVDSVQFSRSIKVYGPPLVHRMKNITAAVGQDVNIKCYVSGYPVSAIQWIKDSTDFYDHSDERIVNEKNLEILKISEDDEGYYTCKAESGRSLISEEKIFINVIKKPKIAPLAPPPSVLEAPSPYSTFCSIISGDHPIKLYWMKDNIDASLISKVDVTNTKTYSLLQIHEVDASHSGNYTCVAENEAGTTRQSIYVRISCDTSKMDNSTRNCKGNIVEIKPFDIENLEVLVNGTLKISTDKNTQGKYSCVVSNGIKPKLVKLVTLEIIDPLKILLEQLKEDHNDTTLQCTVNGSNNIKIQWINSQGIKQVDGITPMKSKVTEKVTTKYTATKPTVNSKLQKNSKIIEKIERQGDATFIGNGPKRGLESEIVSSSKDDSYDLMDSHESRSQNSKMDIKTLLLFVLPAVAVFVLLILLIITLIAYLVTKNSNQRMAENNKMEYSGIDTLHRSGGRTKENRNIESLDRRYGKLERPLPIPDENNDENYQNPYEIPDYCKGTCPIFPTIIQSQLLLLSLKKWTPSSLNNPSPSYDQTNSFQITDKIFAHHDLLVTFYLMPLVFGFTESNSEINGPIFIKEPKYIDGFLNTKDTQLDCSAHGVPDPTIKWVKQNGFRNQEEVKAFPTFIKHIFKRFFVKASTGQQQQQLQAQVYDEYVIPGNTAVLTCHIPSFYKENLKIAAWIREDNLIIKPQAQKDGLKMAANGQLLIENVSSKSKIDLGYWCQIRNKLSGETFLSQSAGKIKLTEHQGSIPPTISHITEKVTAKLGKPTELSCVGQGYPPPNYIWKSKDGNIISESSTLQIEDISKAGTYEYSCIAKNKFGRDERKSVVTVREILKAYILPSVQTVNSGETIKLECIISGHPVDEVVWNFNGKPLTESNGAIITKRKLKISSANGDNEGMYQCMVKNEWESMQTAAQVLLGEQCIPTYKLRAWSHTTYYPKLANMIPEFTETFKSKKLQPGPSISLKCMAGGRPEPKISWKFNGKILTKDNKYVLREKKMAIGSVKSILVIKNVRSFDGGEYMCTASNEVGFVSLTSIPHTQYFQLSGYYVRNYVWSREADPFYQSFANRVSRNKNLRINGTTEEDEGYYTCKSENGRGLSSDKKVFLNVIKKPEISPLAVPPKIMKAHSSYSIVCNIMSGDQPIKLYWLKDNKDISLVQKVYVTNTKRYSLLQIQEMDAEHSGVYSCVAENDAGKSVESVEIQISCKSCINTFKRPYISLAEKQLFSKPTPPRWLVQPINIAASLNSEITLDCMAEGFPQPEVFNQTIKVRFIQYITFDYNPSKKWRDVQMLSIKRWNGSGKSDYVGNKRYPTKRPTTVMKSKILEKIVRLDDASMSTNEAERTKNSASDQYSKQEIKKNMNLAESKSKEDRLDLKTLLIFVLPAIAVFVLLILLIVTLTAYLCTKKSNQKHRSDLFSCLKQIFPNSVVVIKHQDRYFNLKMEYSGIDTLNRSGNWKKQDDGMGSMARRYGRLERPLPIAENTSDPTYQNQYEIPDFYSADSEMKPYSTLQYSTKPPHNTHSMPRNSQASLYNLILYLLYIHFIYIYMAVLQNAISSDITGPIFIKEPKPLAGFLNTEGAQLDCSAHGVPDPKIQWMRQNGLDELQPVKAVPSLMRIFPNGSMVIYDFNADQYRQDIHATVYRCLASNIHGKIISSPVSVKATTKQQQQQLQAQVYDEYVIPGNTGVLTCHIPPFYKDDLEVVSWIREDNLIIKPKLKKNGLRMAENGQLLIENVSRKTNFKLGFWCQIRNRLTGETFLSQSAGRIKVTDNQGGVPPTISHISETVYINMGQEAELTCAGQGHPPPTYVWKSNSDGQVLSESRTLQIKDFSESGTFVYSCIVENKFGSDERKSRLIVRDPLKAYILPNVQTVNSGEKIELKCIVNGHPVLELIWKFNGGSLFDNESVKISKDILVISSANREHEGMYQCMVRNTWESIQTAAQVILGDMAPTFIQTFKSKKLQPGPSISLKCVSVGRPTPQITWNLNGNRIHNNNKFVLRETQMHNGTVVSSVVVKSIRSVDGGEYSCTAINKVDLVTHSKMLNIYGPPMVHDMNNITVAVGEVAVVKCYVSGYPISSIKWNKETKQILKKQKRILSNERVLRIPNVAEKNEGYYTCKAGNGRGLQSHKKLYINVIRKPKISRIVAPHDALQLGSTFSSLCSILNGDQPINIYWLKDGKDASQITKVDVTNTKTYALLQVHDIRIEHKGNYTCVAENKAGKTYNSIKIDVEFSPRWTVQPTDVKVKLNSYGVFLKCEAEGFPSPTVKWHKHTYGW
ncbi:Down syndrome cell adhesion molecule-like protein Dscam2 [Nymphon striatum]|nr:Down syndrome cell adhesion molecule-like protein Dscam2 [Nymphon striatum]